MAATPVGATMAMFLKLFSFKYRRKVVLPVPALPVRNTCREVCCTKPAARRNMELKSVADMGEKKSVKVRKVQG